jgi:membrane-bound serine protease (ClpP class)
VSLLVLIAGFVALVPASALAAPAATTPKVEVKVVEVSGLLDRITARFLRSEIASAQAGEVIVVRLDSPGTVASPDEITALEDTLRATQATVGIWVGPSGARAGGEAPRLLRAATVVATADKAPTLGDFLVSLDTVPTKVVQNPGRPPQRQLADNVRVSFAEPSFAQQLLHAVSTPSAAYLLLVVALLLIVFELFTGGIGVAGFVAVICLALAGYGLGALPTRPLALALVALGIAGCAIDVQVGVPRTWTVIGSVVFAAGSIFLFDGLRVPLLVLVLVLGATLLFMISGVPAVVRTRFSTPTIGRESMVGELGLAATDVAPDGVVTVREAPWRARTNRATPIRAGDEVRVASIDGLLLEVEPLEGAAKDAGH